MRDKIEMEMYLAWHISNLKRFALEDLPVLADQRENPALSKDEFWAELKRVLAMALPSCVEDIEKLYTDIRKIS